MIKSFNIVKFGCFEQLNWNTDVRDSGDNSYYFSKLNIIFGRNYSGKTTISNLLRCLEQKRVPETYANSSFEIFFYNNTSIRSNNIADVNLEIAVFNRHFISENLSFLVYDDGSITPFSVAVIGEKNNEARSKISIIENKLGKAEEESSLYGKSIIQSNIVDSLEKELLKDEQLLNEKLSKKATGGSDSIKQNKKFHEFNYNINKIKSDIEYVYGNGYKPLTSSEIEGLETRLSSTTLNQIQPIEADIFEKINSKIEKCLHILQTPYDLKDVISKELSNSIFSDWIKEGFNLHKETNEKCAFCNNTISEERWSSLKNYFESVYAKTKSDLHEIRNIFSRFFEIDNEDFTRQNELFNSEFKQEFVENNQALLNEIVATKNKIKTLIDFIDSKTENMSNEIYLKQEDFSLTLIEEFISNINKIIEKNNLHNKLDEKEDKKIREKLRLQEVYNFVEAIGYKDIIEKQNKKRIVLTKEKEKNEQLAKEIIELENERAELTKNLVDESAAVAKINSFLNSHFGHYGLNLKSQEDDNQVAIKFEVMRGDDKAFNLSEGERTLIAFCYFIAKLHTNGNISNNQIIVIDDPISSLDSNHIFFIFSLIDEIIARPIIGPNQSKTFKYRQLFILTHSFEFLKYLKKIQMPRNENRHFSLEKKNGKHVIQEMPNYLKKYISELNYLFEKIVRCSILSKESFDANKHEIYYGFGNELRRFLESFLYFNYPYVENENSYFDEKLRDYFGTELGQSSALTRIINERSHLGEYLDNAVTPLDYETLNMAAKFVLKTIKNKNHRQYESFLKSVKMSDPLDDAN